MNELHLAMTRLYQEMTRLVKAANEELDALAFQSFDPEI